jgi:hypothetical protein
MFRWPHYIVRASSSTPIWGEFWWVEGKYKWVFFDDQIWSKTYTETLTHCPDCAQHLERRNLDMVKG